MENDPRNDLALLKISKRPETIAYFRAGRGVRPGEDILALGYPLQNLLSDNLKITKGMDKELMHTPTEKNTLEDGENINIMEKELTSILMEINTVEDGKKINFLSLLKEENSMDKEL